METNTKKTMLSIRQMAIIALMTALTCILAPMSVPIGAVPISLTNFVVYLAVYLLGAKLGTVSYCIYLLCWAVWASGVFRIFRRTGKTSWANRGIFNRIYFDGGSFRHFY